MRYVRNGAVAEQEAKKSLDRAAATGGAAPGARAGAPAPARAPAPDASAPAAGAGKEGMISTSIAALVEVPLRARRASLDSVRRCLAAGRLPPPGLVQIGELITSVPLEAIPGQISGTATIGIAAGPCPWQPDHQLLAIGVTARRVVTRPRPPLNLVLLLEGSAAMRGDDRLDLVKAGLASLVGGLGGADRLSLVVYDAQARLVLDGSRADDAAAALARIDGLAAAAAADGTAAAAGLELAVEAMHRNRRAGSIDVVVLCAAGVPQGGRELAPSLQRLAADGVGVQLMAVGHDHPEDGAFECLAAWGHGTFTYLASAAEAATALGGIGGLREVVAEEALAEISFNQAEISSYRLIGAPPMTRRQPADGAIGGELLAGQSVTLLVEIMRAPQLAQRRLAQEGKDVAADPALVSVRLSYHLADGHDGMPIAARLGVAEAAGQDPIRLGLVAAAAELGLALRHPGDPRYRWDRMLANAQADRSAGAWRGEWLFDLITRAASVPAAAGGR